MNLSNVSSNKLLNGSILLRAVHLLYRLGQVLMASGKERLSIRIILLSTAACSHEDSLVALSQLGK